MAVVILADVSGSMEGPPIARLTEALTSIWPEIKGAKLISFADSPMEVEHPSKLPEPGGGTALHWALTAAAAFDPAKVIVISDGEPDNETAALAAARDIPGVIDVIFCGSESNENAIAFMRKLSRLGGGQTILRDLHDAKALIAPVLRDLLQLPGPIAL
jgi:hypothetical protein